MYRRLAATEIPLNQSARTWHARVTVSLPVAAGEPQRLVPARVRGAREDEEQIRQPVQVDGHERIHRPLRSPPRARRSRPAGTPPARRAAARRPRCRPAARRTSSSGNGRVRLVAVGLEPVDRRLRDPQPAVVRGERHRQVGAEVEQLVLHARRGARREQRPTPTRSASSARRRRRTPRISGSSFDTREPSPSEVSPASPPRV